MFLAVPAAVRALAEHDRVAVREPSMSTDQPDEQNVSPEASAYESTSSPLRTVLFVVLGIMIVALAYDYLYARKQPEAVATEILPQIDMTTSVSNVDPKTMDEVIEIVGREPAEKIEGSNYWQITYRWRAGLPWKTYDLNVVFTKGDPPIYYSHSVGNEQIDYPTESISNSMSEEQREAVYEAVRKATGQNAPETQGESPPPPSEEATAGEAEAPDSSSE